MMGPSHRLLGAVTGAAYATATQGGLGQVLASAALATVTAAGWLSPDVDQTRLAYWLRRMGAGRLLAHRQITHWWLLPLLASAAVPLIDPAMQWAARALVLGWASHLLGDFVFGRIPLVPLGPMLGLGLRTGGWIEGRPLRLVLLATLGWLAIGAPALAQAVI